MNPKTKLLSTAALQTQWASFRVEVTLTSWRDMSSQRSRDVWIWCEITCWRQETFCVLTPHIRGVANTKIMAGREGSSLIMVFSTIIAKQQHCNHATITDRHSYQSKTEIVRSHEPYRRVASHYQPNAINSFTCLSTDRSTTRKTKIKATL
jgi:hypothetical protein